VSNRVPLRFLDIDLDAFLSAVAHWPEGGRLDPNHYVSWTEARLRDFLERQCGLSRSSPIKGWFVENHDAAFEVMRDLVVGGSGPLEVVHVDAHADLGMGDPSWVDLIRHVAKPIADRYYPKRATEGLNLGSWLAYALAAELISDLTYVYPAGYGDDLPPIYFPSGDRTAGFIEMKAYTRPDLPMNGSVPDYHELYTLTPDVALAPVPFRMVTLDDYAAQAPFSAGLLCRSPDYTPETSDALIPIIGEYIDVS
jgi:hypothetical protein